MEWVLYDRDLLHERVNLISNTSNFKRIRKVLKQRELSKSLDTAVRLLKYFKNICLADFHISITTRESFDLYLIKGFNRPLPAQSYH